MRQSTPESKDQTAFLESPVKTGSRGPAGSIGIAMTLGLFLAGLAGAPLAAAETPDLSGTWELDRELSEDPLEVMRGQRDGRRARGLGSGGWGDGPEGIGGPPGGIRVDREQGKSPEEMRQKMEELRQSVERLELTQTDESVRIVFADGREQTFTTNNKKQSIDTPLGKGEVKARWRDGILVVRTKIDRHMTVETYYLAEGSDLLTVVVEQSLEGATEPLSYRRIYRPYNM
jgi:hypothetical protein